MQILNLVTLMNLLCKLYLTFHNNQELLMFAHKTPNFNKNKLQLLLSETNLDTMLNCFEIII